MSQPLVFDYIVVGAGSAGCVVASRLSQSASVLLLERGGPDTGIRNGVDVDALVSDPGGIIRAAWNRVISVPVETEPERSLDGRRVIINRGVVFGGCHAVNGMIYVRGHRRDFDGWARLGNDAWSFDEVLPYFKRSEEFDGSPLTYAAEDLAYHGTTGPMHVRPVPDPTSFTAAFIDAARDLGHGGGTPHWDFNGRQQENGAGLFQVTVTADRKRVSTARAFLADAATRPRLRVVFDAVVNRVLLERRRAVGVEYIAGGRRMRANVDGEVILCAGAFESPKLLMLSGLGPAAALRNAAIPCVVDLPGVGENLHDHPMVVIAYETAKDPGQSTFTAEAGLFLDTRGRSETRSPDLQYHALGKMPAVPDVLEPIRRVLPGQYFTLCPTVCQPESRGRITLRPGQPMALPLVRASYLQHEADWRVLEHGIELMHALAATPSIRAFGPRTPPFVARPGYRVALPLRGSVRPFIAETLTTTWHPAGTCKMGRDPQAVVDPELRVHGVTGLRVADASIMPTPITGNINAACIMIGEKCADLVRRGAAAVARPAGGDANLGEDALFAVLRAVLARDRPAS